MQTRSPNWPTAAILMVALVAIAATVLAGPSLGLDGETLRYVLGSEAGLGLVVLGVMRGLLDGRAAMLALVVLASATLPACSTAATAAPALITARDLTCRGGRVICRVTDRVCRTTGGPWVVPQSDAEREEWRAMGDGDDEPDGPTSGDDEAEGEAAEK